MIGSKVMVVLAVCLVCFTTTTYSNTPSRIINGQKADKGEFPFIVSVETIGHFCGGTILDEYWILTAAHCVQDPDGSDAFPASDMVIITDAEDDWYPDGSKYQVDSFYAHESYNFSNSQENDIALIKLAEPIKFNDYVSAADLPIEDIDDNTGAMIAGWGATYEEEGEEDSASRFLNKVPVFTIETQDCDIKWQMGTDRIQPGQVCIHAYKKGEGACEGDSGGPLSVNNTVIGIGSFVISCGGTYPDVYTRVYHFLDWIKKTKENN